MIVPRYYEDLEILHDNTMPARAYYIPASKKMDDLIEHRETSDRFQLPISVIHFRLILHMSHRISHAAPMLRFLPIIQMNRHRWHT